MRFAVVLLIAAVAALVACIDVPDSCPQIDPHDCYVKESSYSLADRVKSELFLRFPFLHRLATTDCYTTGLPNPLCVPKFIDSGFHDAPRENIELVPVQRPAAADLLGFEIPLEEGTSHSCASQKRTVVIADDADPFAVGNLEAE